METSDWASLKMSLLYQIMSSSRDIFQKSFMTLETTVPRCSTILKNTCARSSFQTLQPATLSKKAPEQGFSCEFFRNFTELLCGFWWLLLSTFLKYLDGCSSTRVAQKFFFQRFRSTSFLYKEEVGEKEGLGWIFLEELLKCLNKHPTFVYIPLLTVNVWRRVLR